MTDSDVDTIRTILGAARYATVTTRSGDHALHSRPLAILDADSVSVLYFFTPDPSPKTSEIAHHPEVNVAVGDGKGHLSFSGTASVTRDPELIDRYWNPYAEAWFENGRDDPTVALLAVHVDSVEYWDTDRPAIAQAFEVVKGIVTRTPPRVGENRTVEF